MAKTTGGADFFVNLSGSADFSYCPALNAIERQ